MNLQEIKQRRLQDLENANDIIDVGNKLLLFGIFMAESPYGFTNQARDMLVNLNDKLVEIADRLAAVDDPGEQDKHLRDYIEDLATDVDSVATSLHPQMIHERTVENARETLRAIANTMRKAADREV